MLENIISKYKIENEIIYYKRYNEGNEIFLIDEIKEFLETQNILFNLKILDDLSINFQILIISYIFNKDLIIDTYNLKKF